MTDITYLKTLALCLCSGCQAIVAAHIADMESAKRADQRRKAAERQRRHRARAGPSVTERDAPLRYVMSRVTERDSNTSFLLSKEKKETDDDDMRARANAIAGKAIAIFGMTLDTIEPGWCGLAGWIEGELRGGALRESDVIEAAMLVRRKRADFMPQSYRYLITVINDVRTNRQRELPLLRVMETGNGRHQTGGNCSPGSREDFARALAKAKQRIAELREEEEREERVSGLGDEAPGIAPPWISRRP